MLDFHIIFNTGCPTVIVHSNISGSNAILIPQIGKIGFLEALVLEEITATLCDFRLTKANKN